MKKHIILFSMIIIYILGISGYGYYSYFKNKENIIEGIDKQLKSTAFAIPIILGESYHSKDMNRESISDDYYLSHMKLLSQYADITGIKYLYSFVKVKGEVIFVSSSYTQDELKEDSLTKYWDIYEDATDKLINSFESGKIIYEESSDQWGTFRSVLIPIKQGEFTYVLGADIEISYIAEILQDEIVTFVLTGLFFLLLLIPVILLYIRTMEREKKSLEEVIELKTGELQAINRDLQNLSTQLSKYLSPQLYQSIFTGKKEVKIEAKRKKLTVFFSDIKNFTKTTDHLEPEDLTYLLNNYLNEMSIIALKYGATIDKFIGDAILIFFGDPESKGVKEDALLCVSMAIEMKQRMGELREKWQKDGVTQPFQIRMGINTGYCTVGNFGSDSKLDYTIIGNQVNLASRLESNADVDEILISEETYLLVKEQVTCVKRGLIEAKGFDHPIQTYQVNDTFQRHFLEERQSGFSLSIDFDHYDMNRDSVIKVLENTIKELQKEKE